MLRSSLTFALPRIAFIAGGLALLGPFASTGSAPTAARVQAAQDPAADPAFYTGHVKPILEANCARCHGALNHRGGFNLETRDAMLKGGHHGPGVVPGDPGASWMVRLIRHEGPANDPMNMPQNRPKLSDADIATVEQWVKAGAVMP